MKYKVGDRVKVKSEFDIYEEYRDKQFVIEECDSSDNTYLCHPTTGGYKIWFSEERLEPVTIRSVLFPNVEYVFNEKQAEEYADNIIATAESISHITGNPYENSINKLKTCLSAFPNDGISAKNGGKNSMKFTFYFNVNEGTRVDKSCNGTIPTMTTNIELLGGNVSDRVISIEGSATCDKADYDMRQGVLEALANAVFDGNFEKAYNKAAKANALCERQDRTCYYCGKVFDTVEKKQEHEEWHVERKKARRERYLLRKRAKEIAFEEQAQKMAKEMITENKKEAK